MSTGFEKELETFESMRAELLGKASGKYALVKGDQVIDVLESQQDAIKRGYELYGNEPFLVKQIVEIDIPANFTSFSIGV